MFKFGNGQNRLTFENPTKTYLNDFMFKGASQIGIAILRGGPTFDHVDDEHIVPEPGNSDWHMFGQSVC